MDVFTTAYLTCALWAETDNGEPLDRIYSTADIAPRAMAAAVLDCEKFQREHWDLIDINLAHAGHDFWLTRNGHGAGFWDGAWNEPAATTLTNASNAAGNLDLYVGDDGMIYGFGE